MWVDYKTFCKSMMINPFIEKFIQLQYYYMDTSYHFIVNIYSIQ